MVLVFIFDQEVSQSASQYRYGLFLNTRNTFCGKWYWHVSHS